MKYLLSLLLLWGAMIVPAAQAQPTADDTEWHAPLRTFWVPSGSMNPTLAPGDGVIAKRVEPRELKRGDVIAFRVGGPRQIWFSRLIGLPGDVVEVRNGQVILNGEPVPQRVLGAGPDLPIMGSTRTQSSQLIEERLPDTAAAHHVLDLGLDRVDNAPALRVPAGRLYVLGDNRDDAVDSRLTGQMGPGMVALVDVYGVIEEILPGAFPIKPSQPRSEKLPPQIVPSR